MSRRIAKRVVDLACIFTEAIATACLRLLGYLPNHVLKSHVGASVPRSRRLMQAKERTSLPRALPILAVLFGFLPYVSTIKWPPIASFWSEWTCAVIAAGLAMVIGKGKPGEEAHTASIPLGSLVCAAYALMVLAQLVARQPYFPGLALLAVAELSLAAVLCSAAARLRASGMAGGILDAWAFGLTIALLFNAFEVLLERNGWQAYLTTLIPREPGQRALGLFGQPNQLAVFAVMAWCAGQYLWMRRKLSGAYWLGVAALVGLIGAGAASRAGVLLWVGVIALGWMALRSHERGREGRRLLLCAAALSFLMQIVWTLSTSVDVSGVTVFRSDAKPRLELLRDGLQLIALHPLTGVGFGNFAGARWQELSGSMLEPTTRHAHNMAVQLAAELGVVGSLVILLPLAWCLFLAGRAATRRSTTPEAFFVAAVLLLLTGYSLLEYPLWYCFFLFPFGFLLGLVEQPALTLRSIQREPMIVLRLGAWLAVATLLMVIVLDYLRIQSLYTDTALRALNERRALTSKDVPRQQTHDIAMLTAFDMYAELMLSRTLVPNGIAMAEKLHITERAMLAFPSSETVSRHIEFLVAAGKDVEARLVWMKTERNVELRKETTARYRRGS